MDYRTFLSASYRCEEAWNKRLQLPLIAAIKPSEYFYELDLKYKQEGKVSAIDVDLFVNKIEKSEAVGFEDEIEDLIHRLRRSPETVRTLPSTPHAVLRVLCGSSGINSHAPGRFWLLVDPGTDIGFLLFLRHLGGEPTVKIRVKFLRNPYFDDHFDLKDPNHIVGKTLAWLSPLIGGSVGISCEILGWALYNKWKELDTALDSANKGTDSVAASVLTRVKNFLETCDDLEIKERITSGILRLEASGDKVAELDLGSCINEMVQKAATEAESSDIKAQEDTYLSWEKIRENEFQVQLDEYKKRQLLAEIERKKKDLAEREEVIFFFDNKEKLEMYYPKKLSLRYPKKKPRKVDEGYIPPEVIQR
ncbi:putative Mitochondrial 28S ribosomal protein S27-containing protein [Homarus americanus]|uniref:Putative Mitochondrial 28S ribosomal protein S27-containing protein n=1 Tax=Homarus americanus TaxID=6706 RepID=A0A8J5JTT0_HOMAM|nr:putative Mitochondrial 28S ribosomal protein S27-containing protein [Homarus americanus]